MTVLYHGQSSKIPMKPVKSGWMAWQKQKLAKQCKCCFCNLLKNKIKPLQFVMAVQVYFKEVFFPPFPLIVPTFFVSLCQLGAHESLVKPHLEILCLTQNDVGQNGRELWPGMCRRKVLDTGLWVIRIKRVRHASVCNGREMTVATFSVRLR